MSQIHLHVQKPDPRPIRGSPSQQSIRLLAEPESREPVLFLSLCGETPLKEKSRWSEQFSVHAGKSGQPTVHETAAESVPGALSEQESVCNEGSVPSHTDWGSEHSELGLVDWGSHEWVHIGECQG